MTFARVTDTGMDEHAPLYSTVWGVSTGTFPGFAGARAESFR